VVLLGLVAGLQAGELVPLPPKKQAGATKTLSFPPDQWVGNLSLEPESGPGWDPRGVRLSDEWEHFGPARGDVRVPRDRHVWLNIHLGLNSREAARLQRENPQAYQFSIADRVQERQRDLSGLLRLDPNDLFRLSVISPMHRRTGADPAIFEPIGRLTGLRILSLESSGITDIGMECLRPLRSLTALELTQSSIGPRGLAVLKELPALEHLDLSTAVTDAGLKEVAQASGLRSLHIANGTMWGPGLAELAKLPRLEQLCIWESDLSDRHIQHLEGLTNLKVLAFWYVGGALTDSSLASIARLKGLEELRFAMSSPKFTPAGVAHLKDLKNLRLVDFGEFTWITPAGQQYGDEVARQLAGISGLESILGIGCLSSEGMKVLSTMANLKRLNATLKDARIGYPGPTGLSYLANLRSLEELNISTGDPLADNDLAAMESLTGLKKLVIFCPSVSDKGMASIGKLRQLENLTLMTKVTRNGLNQLNGLSRLRQLQASGHYETSAVAQLDETPLDLSGLKSLVDLQLGGLSLNDEDLAFLTRLSSLERLMIQPTSPLMGKSLRHLGDLPELNCLLLYNVSNCSGEDLTCLGRLPKLRLLRADGDITDTALASLTGLASLGSLEVSTNAPIRRETVTNLAAKLPQLESVHIRELPPWMTRPAEAGKDTGIESAPVNRRPATTGRRGRR
jgi:Leucine-rich repeat (LRR) protein